MMGYFRCTRFLCTGAVGLFGLTAFAADGLSPSANAPTGPSAAAPSTGAFAGQHKSVMKAQKLDYFEMVQQTIRAKREAGILNGTIELPAVPGGDNGPGIRGECANAQPGDIEEGEPFGGCADDYSDTFNAGCNSDPPSFSEIDCGDTVHGESGTFLAFGLNYRDTDWWLHSVGGTGEILTFTCTADFPVLIGFVRQPCPQGSFMTFAFGDPCVTTSVSSACLPPGDYVCFVAPSDFFNIPCGGQYRATLTCEPCSPPPPPANDNCAGATPILCGSTINGDNTSATNDGLQPSCSFAGFPTNSDVWYSVVATDTTMVASTCGGGSMSDTVVSIYSDCNGTEIACNDDACAPLLSQATANGLTVGNTYYIRVAGWDQEPQGTFTLEVTCRGPCAAAQPGDVEENEPFGGCADEYVDSFNGGCNSAPPAFSPITCGQSVHGESGTFLSGGLQFRDTDWWLVNVSAPGAILQWTVTADFPVLIGFVPQPCPQGAFIPGTAFTAPACTEVTSITECLQPGQYVAFVAPSGFSGVSCGSQYRGTLTCTPCTPPPPPANNNCADAIAIACGQTVNGTNIDSSTDGAWPCAAGGNDVWYSYVAAGPSVRLNLCGSGYDTSVMLLDNCGGTVLGCNDDSAQCGLQSILDVGGLTPGATYLIAVGGFASSEGNFTMSVEGCAPTGACCTATACVVTTQANCLSQGGSYQGDGTDCGGQNYNVSRGNVPMEDISVSGTPGCSGDDCSSLVALGFTFNYYGNSFTDVNVGSNGHLRFGGAATVFGNPPSLPQPDFYDNIIAPYWDDWRTDAVCPGGNATLDTQTLGAAPNRRFIAQWTNVCHFGNNAQRATFQAILYEATGNIEYRYGTPLALNSPVVGIENSDGTDGLTVIPIPVSNESVLISAETTGDPCGCECDGDVNGSGNVDLADLALLLSAFGGSGGGCADIDGSGTVDLADLAVLLSAFGSTCP